MHELFLFVFVQLQGLEGANLPEGDKSHLLCQAKKGKGTLEKKYIIPLQSLNYP